MRYELSSVVKFMCYTFSFNVVKVLLMGCIDKLFVVPLRLILTLNILSI